MTGLGKSSKAKISLNLDNMHRVTILNVERNSFSLKLFPIKHIEQCLKGGVGVELGRVWGCMTPF